MQLTDFLNMHPDDRHRWWERELHANGGPHGTKHTALVEAAKGNPEAALAVHRARHGNMPDALDAFMRKSAEERAAFVYGADHAALNEITSAIPHALPPDPDPHYAERVAKGGSALRTKRADPALWRDRFRDVLNAATQAAEQRAAKEARSVADRAAADYMRTYYQHKRPSA